MSIEDRVWAYRQTRSQIEFAKAYQETSGYRERITYLQWKKNGSILGRDFEILEELSDQAFMKAMDTYDGRNNSSFNTYFYRIFVNKVRDAVRSAIRRYAPSPSGFDCDLQPSQVDTAKTVDNKDYSEVLLKSLSPFKRMIVMMRHEGNTFREIAKALGRTRKASGNRIGVIYREAIESLKSEAQRFSR